jgi:hypothetical protein
MHPDMAQSQLAFAHDPSLEIEVIPRFHLGRELRLAGIPHVLESIRTILSGMPSRIELDASGLRLMTEGARQVLVAATQHLAARQVELIVIGCEPFD